MSQESTSYEITGTLLCKMDQVTFASGFSKREFVITKEGRYPKPIKLEVVKDKCALLDNFREGERINVSFDVDGNENNGRYYVSLKAWRIASFGAEKPAAQEPPDAYTPPADTDENYPF
jgi:hypothetical protein